MQYLFKILPLLGLSLFALAFPAFGQYSVFTVGPIDAAAGLNSDPERLDSGWWPASYNFSDPPGTSASQAAGDIADYCNDQLKVDAVAIGNSVYYDTAQMDFVGEDSLYGTLGFFDWNPSQTRVDSTEDSSGDLTQLGPNPPSGSGSGNGSGGGSGPFLEYNSSATGVNSIALGSDTLADGDNSTSLGLYTTASGYASTAMGNLSIASGSFSTAMGYLSTASGCFSTAMGNHTTAPAYAELTLGQYNVGAIAAGGDSTWISTDPLLELGNGTSSTPSDALIVYKNGNTTINGTDNEMPNQTLVNSNSVLTVGMADARYSTGSGNNNYNNGTPVYTNGSDSTAIGNSVVNAYAATASGQSTADGDNSTAMGASSAYATYSTALGNSGAGGQCSTAMGISNANGFASTSMGASTANGQSSTAMGSSTTANGQYSTAMGSLTYANGYYSTAMGSRTSAQAYDSVAMGANNVGGGDPANWVPTDPLFEIGNGISPSSANNWQTTPSDALVVYKNGNVTAGGVITAQPGGDIPMYNPNSN